MEENDLVITAAARVFTKRVSAHALQPAVFVVDHQLADRTLVLARPSAAVAVKGSHPRG